MPAIIWVLLIPLPHDEVTQQLTYALSEGINTLEKRNDFVILPGTRLHTAIVNTSMDLAPLDARLAELFSLTVDQPVYLFWMEDFSETDLNTPSIRVYNQGSISDMLNEEPLTFAQQLGISFPSNLVGDELAPVYSVCVLEGISPSQAAAALGLSTPSASDMLHIKAVEKDVLIYSESGDASALLYQLSQELPEITISHVLHGPEPDRFAVYIFKGNREIGAFETSPYKDPTFPKLKTIRGEKEPNEIASKFGIPLKLLGLNS